MSRKNCVILPLQGVSPSVRTLSFYEKIQRQHYVLFNLPSHSFSTLFFGGWVWCFIDPGEAWLLVSVFFITSALLFQKYNSFSTNTWNVGCLKICIIKYIFNIYVSTKNQNCEHQSVFRMGPNPLWIALKRGPNWSGNSF